ncbi:MAG: DUF559 domain-containing protein [Candidatus Cloacimonetes bacterium]|nr:DUF559 domain-containing protein [Candidatus Cloacimonadota bacterium]
MPKKGYKQTEKHKREISKKLKGQIPWNKDIPCSENTKERISISKKGKKLGPQSEEHKEKLRKIKKIFTKEQEQQICNEYFSKKKPNIMTLGKKWNCDGTTISNILKRNGYILRTHSEATKGQKAWNKNLTKETDERVAKYSRPRSEEARKKMSKSALLRIQNNSGPYKNTKPELEMKNILNELNIPFKHQFRLGNHLFDFRISDSNILIEVDGDYWHGNPKKFKKLSKRQQKQKQRDIKNEKLAKTNNFILLRFWQNDVLNNQRVVKDRLKTIIICEEKK